MIEIIPGILEKDFEAIEDRVRLVAPHVSWVQIDVCDETYVPNKTFLDWEKFAALTSPHSYGSRLLFEAHMMVSNPTKYIRPMVDAGFKRLIAHVECDDPRTFLHEARHEDIEVGLAIDGMTEFEEIEPFLDQVDCVLVMTIEAGFSGRPFLPETVEKIKTINRNLPNLPIEVDGGINDQTAKLVKDAGATRMVSTSYLFKHPASIADAIETLAR